MPSVLSVALTATIGVYAFAPTEAPLSVPHNGPAQRVFCSVEPDIASLRVGESPSELVPLDDVDMADWYTTGFNRGDADRRHLFVRNDGDVEMHIHLKLTGIEVPPQFTGDTPLVFTTFDEAIPSPGEGDSISLNIGTIRPGETRAISVTTELGEPLGHDAGGTYRMKLQAWADCTATAEDNTITYTETSADTGQTATVGGLASSRYTLVILAIGTALVAAGTALRRQR